MLESYKAVLGTASSFPSLRVDVSTFRRRRRLIGLQDVEALAKDCALKTNHQQKLTICGAPNCGLLLMISSSQTPI